MKKRVFVSNRLSNLRIVNIFFGTFWSESDKILGGGGMGGGEGVGEW